MMMTGKQGNTSMVFARIIKDAEGASCFSWGIAMVGLMATFDTTHQARKQQDLSSAGYWCCLVCIWLFLESVYVSNSETVLYQNYTEGNLCRYHRSDPRLKLAIPSCSMIAPTSLLPWTISFHWFPMFFQFPGAQINFLLPYSGIF